MTGYMLTQIMIGICGAIAVSLTQSRYESRRRYACLFGLAGQPWWFYAAVTSQQWGIFFVCFLYTFAWLRGFYNHFIKPL